MPYYNATDDPSDGWSNHWSNGKGIDLDLIDNIEFQGIDTADYPDFSDASILSADYDGREMTTEEIEWVNDNCQEYIHEQVLNHLF